jgi:tRNA threonylcarbamoyladenosine biosynthesis protein TsaB
MILLIDTSAETAFTGIALDGKLLAVAVNPNRQDHAAWLHPAIENLVREAGTRLQALKAVAITGGPGSYTGLRVSMAAAKGICYALQIPLIVENTLFVMARAMREEALSRAARLLCPLIDARRQEVFTAVYNPEGQTVLSPRTLILDKNSFDDFLKSGPVLFFGSGASKWKEINDSAQALFAPEPPLAQALADLSFVRYRAADFTGIHYAEPVYLKDFYTHGKK